MRYNSIDDQNKTFISILKQNKDLMSILDYIADLNLSNFYIAAGVVFQSIWNYYDNRPFNYRVKDIDIIFYDSSNISKDFDQELENKITNYFKNLNYVFDVHNEARMHLWAKEKENKDIEQYKNSEDAIDHWIVTVHAVGITKKDNEIKVYAPYGLSDIFSRTIRPIKHENSSKELYEMKAASFKIRFANLTIIKW